ncbi:hypothetical protein H2200_002753 [Cladophialophora chaetospira]|uniref:Major facilitator superfamily (MFS) profile domain-containing protein n=1 Tax=Cladophialophora chaetospira TaxID=386627 RepID=A0AA39CME2_9EURO|nr:hypothetical protein H2200_002753 [Cladophialophora chaetospira]
MASSKEASMQTAEHTEVLKIDSEVDMQTGQPQHDDDMEAYQSRKLDFRTVMALLALAFSYEACLFSFVLPAAILLTINADVGPSAQITWVATSWSLAIAVVQTIAGRCSDIFGRRNFFIVGNSLGVIGCAIASRAKTVNTIIAGSCLMGIGAGLQQLAFAAASEIVPRKHRGAAQSLLSVVSLPGSTFGSVIAFALVAHLTWRWAFYLGIIINGFALFLVVVFYWPPGFIGLHPDGKSRIQQIKELDFVGLTLFGGGLTTFLVGVSFGGNPYSWRDVHVVAPLLIGGLCVFVAFPLWEVLSSNKIEKLCPPHLFADVRGFVCPLGVVFASGMTLTSLQVLWPQQVQLLFTTVPTIVGWYTVAYNASATVGVVFGGPIFSYLRRTRYQFPFVVFMQVVFIGLMATVDQHTPARAIVFVGIASFMIGASQVMAILLIQFGASDQEIGVSTGLLNSVRSTGGAIAIAIYSSLIHSKATHNLVPDVASAAVKAGLPSASIESFIVALTSGSASALEAVRGITPAIIAAGVDAEKSVYAGAFKLVFEVSMVFGGLACIGASCIRSVDHKMTRQVAVKVDAPHLLGHGKGEAKVLSKTEEECKVPRLDV